MNITLALVTSLNGKLTNGLDSNIYAWTSQEDQDHFFSLIGKYNLIIMGRKTYEAAKDKIKLVSGKLRIVMTSHAKKMTVKQVPGQLEYSSETPNELIDRLAALGYKSALLVGGSETATQFFEAELVTEVLLTLEPKIFGSGNHFITNSTVQIDLRLLSVQKINESGTLLAQYAVIK